MIVPANRRLDRKSREAFTLLEVLVVVAILVVLASVAGIYIFRYLEDARADATILKMQALERACKAYAIKRDGQFPQDLSLLIAPDDFTGDPYLEGGPDAIMSSWQTPIAYSLEPGPGGEATPVFRAQSPDGKRTAIWPVWARTR